MKKIINLSTNFWIPPPRFYYGHYLCLKILIYQLYDIDSLILVERLINRILLYPLPLFVVDILF